MDLQAAKRSLSFILYGGQKEYENYLQIKEYLQNQKGALPPPEYHQFTLQERLSFIKAQHQLILKYIRTGSSSIEETISPLYALTGPEVGRNFQIHLQYLKVLKEFFPHQTSLIEKAQNFQNLGSWLIDEYEFPNKNRINHDFDAIKTQVQNINGKYFVSTPTGLGKSGLYYAGQFSDIAIVFCQSDQKNYLAIIKLKDQFGNTAKGIYVKWLGKSMQLTCNWSIHFENAEVLELVEVQDQTRISILGGLMVLQDAFNQLNDILRLSYLSIKYSTMRKQFKTTEDNTERPILTYQISTERINNALSFAVSQIVTYHSLKDKYLVEIKKNKPRSYQNYLIVRHFASQVSQKGTEIVEILRETMGGYGFLRFSGAPTIQERSMWMYNHYTYDSDKYADQLLSVFGDFQKNQEFINQMIGFSLAKSPQLIISELGEINEEIVKNPFKMFAYNSSKIRQTLQSYEGKTINALQKIAAADLILNLFAGIQFFSLLAYRRYRQSNYILDRLYLYSQLKDLMQIETDLKTRNLLNLTITKTQQDLLKYFTLIVDSLEIQGTFTDCLVGQQNEDDFYEQLLDLAKNHNQRNDPKIKGRITKELSEYLQRPKL